MVLIGSSPTYALDLNATISRLDFAVDYFGPSSPEELHHAWEQGHLRTPARCVTPIARKRHTKDGIEAAHTVYFGRRVSDRSLCCYDKAMQTGRPGPWTRIELRTRDEQGQRLGQAMREHGIAVAGKQAIREYVRCDIPWFNQATSGPSVYMPPVQDKKSDLRRWLLEFILPRWLEVIKADALVGDFEVRDAFLTALHEALAYYAKGAS